jgi:integrase
MPDELVRHNPAPLAAAGAAADAAAARGVFADYRASSAERTRSAQDDDLVRWAAYLAAAGLPPCEGWAERPECWRGVSWGLVRGFIQWQLDQGYALGTVNRSLSTVRKYAELAMQAGELSAEALTAIRTVKGYGPKKGRRIDEGRETTRKGDKKAQFLVLSRDEIKRLKAAPNLDTPSGRRDLLVLCLLVDHGLRVGEVEGLQVTNLDPKAGTITFWREKVGREQTHKLSADTLRAVLAYLPDAPPVGSLWRGSRRGGRLTDSGWSRASIAERVNAYGHQIGLPNLRPHDLRHTWATWAARNGTPLDRLQDAGGWASMAMPLRYIERAKIANEGVRTEEG